ncbi:MAG: hypothetical protein K9H16_02010 [Bacteroidales bacterium]|nr:hypothetical protein [Bacteroidales bacterium]
MSFENISKEKNFWIIMVNSLSYFMLAYVAVVMLTNSFSILLANIEGVNGVLYYYGFDVLNPDRTWSGELTFLIFFLGIGFSFALGLLFERIYKLRRKHTSHLKLFFLWGYILSFTYFFGNVIVGAFFYFGTGVLFDTFSIPVLFRVVAGVVAAGALVYMGIYSTRGFVISLNSYQTFIERTEFNWFLKAQLLYPSIIGSVLILFLKIPHHNDFLMLDTLIWFALVIPVVTIFINLKGETSIRFKRKNLKIQIFKLPIIIFLIIILIYRLGLSNGLEF